MPTTTSAIIAYCFHESFSFRKMRLQTTEATQ